MILGFGIGALTAGAVAAHGAFFRNSRVFASPLGRLPPSPHPEIALTLDDGPNPETTPRVLDVLAEAGVQATFFVLGRHAERWPALVARIAAEGHSLGNHGYYHRRLPFRGPEYTRRDLQLGNAAIRAASGTTPALFRAPHGFLNPWVRGTARQLGQRVVGWTLGVRDSDRPGADVIAERVIGGVRPRSIVLLHDGDAYDPLGDRTQTAAALPHIIASLAGHGFRFVTVPPR